MLGMAAGFLGTLIAVVVAFTQKQRRSKALRLAAVYFVLFISTMTLIQYNWHLAEQRSVPLISAIERFHSDRGRYPETLEELVPAYLPSVPNAGFTLMSRRFHYFSARPQLYFAVMFHGMAFYDFPTKTWLTNE